MAAYLCPPKEHVAKCEDCESTAITVGTAVMADAMADSPLSDSLKVYAAIELAFKFARDDDYCDRVFHEVMIMREMARGEWLKGDDLSGDDRSGDEDEAI